MSIAKKLILPSLVAVAGFVGVSGASLASNVAASADTATTTSSTTATTPTTTTSTTTDTTGTTPTAPPSGSANQGPHTANGITETVLTGDSLTKATTAATAAESGATVVRAETDADGATYEVHMKKSDGSMVTVKLDANYKVTSTENGM